MVPGGFARDGDVAGRDRSGDQRSNLHSVTCASMQVSGSMTDAAVKRTRDGGTAGTVEPIEQALDHCRLRAEVCRVLIDPKRLMLLTVLRRASG